MISRNVYLFLVINISILKGYVDFQKCIPISGYKNICFDESTLISRNEFLFQVIKIAILIKYVDFQKFIPVSEVIKRYILMKYIDFRKCIPVSGYKNIYFDEVR